MASKKTLTTAVEVDTDTAQRNLSKLGDAAKDAGRDADRAADDVDAFGKDAKDAAVDVDRLADELRNTAKVTDDFADDTRRAGDRIEDTYKTVEGGAHGTASAIGEAFGEGGGVQSGLGSATEAVESFAQMFGPAGMIVSFIGGAAIGALTRFLDKSDELSEAVKARAQEISDVLLEMEGNLDEAYATEQVLEWIKQNGKAYDSIAELENGSELLTKAFQGDKVATNQLISALEDLIDTDEDRLQQIEDKVAQTGYATQAEQREYEQIKDRIAQTKDTIGLVKDEEAAIRNANSTYDRQNGYLKANTDAKNDNADATANAAEQHRRLASNAYDANAALRQGGGGPSGGKSWLTRAGGGPVEAGRPTVVGEYGKEVFVPNTDGTIIPQHDLRRGLGGGGTVVVNVTTSDPDRMAAHTVRALRRARFRQGL